MCGRDQGCVFHFGWQVGVVLKVVIQRKAEARPREHPGEEKYGQLSVGSSSRNQKTRPHSDNTLEDFFFVFG